MIVQLPASDTMVTVLFRLPAAIWADNIQVVGDFNGWNTSADPMRLGDVYWEANVTMEAGGTYYYAYLIDGVEWCSEGVNVAQVGIDPQAVRLLPIPIEHPLRRPGC